MSNKVVTSWREKLDTFDDEIIECTLTADQLDYEFDDGFGGSCGHSFTAWSEKYVYFPVVYDGSEWVGRAPRNPCDEATPHQGGE